MINSEVVDAVYSDDIANDSHIGSMHGGDDDSPIGEGGASAMAGGVD